MLVAPRRQRQPPPPADAAAGDDGWGPLGAGALGAGGDLHQANTTVANATAWCLASAECGGFTTDAPHASACDISNTTVRKIYFKASCHDIAAIWLAFFSRCQRYRC